MAQVTIHGMAQSTYVRTCRLVCEEKGIAYERRDAAPHSPLQKSRYLAGDRLTLADLFLAPILFWLEKTPEGQAALPKYPAVGRWYQALDERPSFRATIPPMPGAA